MRVNSGPAMSAHQAWMRSSACWWGEPMGEPW